MLFDTFDTKHNWETNGVALGRGTQGYGQKSNVVKDNPEPRT